MLTIVFMPSGFRLFGDGHHLKGAAVGDDAVG